MKFLSESYLHRWPLSGPRLPAQYLRRQVGRQVLWGTRRKSAGQIMLSKNAMVFESAVSVTIAFLVAAV